MKQIPVFFKSDFTAILASEAQWGGVPFRLKFYTASPSRAFVACYDGEHYENCRLLEDGRLEIAFNQKDGTVQTLMGIGMLMLAPEFYLTNDAYRDHICNQFIKPFAPVFVDEDGEEYNLVLGLEGAASIVTVGTLPAFYQKGDPGLTPEEHDALVQATENANTAADRAEQSAQSANTAAENANTEAGKAVEAARLADAARQQLTTTFNEKVAALEADYAQKKAALDADYAGVKQSLSADYSAKKAALDADYVSAKSALSTAYAETIASLNSRMSAIEAQFATDRIEWQHQVDAILTKCMQDFEAAEAERESRVASAIANANTATANANTAATHAGNVNAVLNGDELTVTDRNGQSVTRNVRGPKGEPGASVTFFPAVTIFGQPHIDGPQISGFSANDYLQFPFVVNFAGRPWELHFDIATGAEVNQQHNIFDSNFGLAFAFANGHFVMAMSSNGTSWDLGANEGTHAILPNQTYHIRMSWDGTTYKMEFSIDEVDWVTDIQVASTASLYPRQIVIGKDIFTGTHFYNGSINFAHAQLKIAGLVVWEGMEEIGTATRMAIDMSNIDEAGKQKLNEVAMEGEVGEKIGELSSKIDSISNDGSEPLIDYDATNDAEFYTKSRFNESLQIVASTSAYIAYKLDVSRYEGGSATFLSYGNAGYCNGFIMQDGSTYGVLPAYEKGYNKPTTYDIPKNAKYLCITNASALTQQILINLGAVGKGRLEIVEEEIVKINEKIAEHKKNKLHFTTDEGGFSRIVSGYNEEEELVLACEFYPNRQNKVFNYRSLYKRNKVTEVETELKSCTDDICPVLMGSGSSYIGGAHGAFGFMKVPATHDKAVNDIGSVWSSGGINYVLVGVESGKVWLISENQSEYPKFSFATPSANATFTHVRGASHTSNFTIGALPSASQRQWWPMCNNNIRIYADDTEITQSGDYEFDVLKVVEYYDIPNPASCVEILKQNVGTFTENVTPSMLVGADKVLRISNVYTINGAEEQFVAATLTFLQDGYFDFFGFTQSIGVGGEHYWQYIPKAKSLDGNTAYDFRTIVDMKGNRGGKIRPDDYEDAQLPPDRFLQFDENVGQFISYLFDYGVGGRNRAENNYAAFYFSSNGDAKQYPMGWSKSAGIGVKAYESKSAVCWRRFIEPTKINKNGEISVNVFEYDDKLYIYADYNAAGLYDVEIPQKYVGKKIEVFEKRDNVHLLNDVSNSKIQIKVDADEVMYGYLVAQIKL